MGILMVAACDFSVNMPYHGMTYMTICGNILSAEAPIWGFYRVISMTALFVNIRCVRLNNGYDEYAFVLFISYLFVLWSFSL